MAVRNVLFVDEDKFDINVYKKLQPCMVVLRGVSVPNMRSIVNAVNQELPNVLEYASLLKEPVNDVVPRRCLYYWILTEGFIKKKSVKIPFEYLATFGGGYVGEVRALQFAKNKSAVSGMINLVDLYQRRSYTAVEFLEVSRARLDPQRVGVVKNKPSPLRASCYRIIEIDRGLCDWCFSLFGGANASLLKEDGSLAIDHLFYFVNKWLEAYNIQPKFYWCSNARPSDSVVTLLNVTLNRCEDIK